MNTHLLSRAKHIRADGWLCELVSMNHSDDPFSDIHTYLVSISPNMTRANHYHKKKEEWIAPTAGIIEISTVDTRTNKKEKIVLDTNTEEYSIVHIPPYIAHSLKNIGNCHASVVVFSKTPEDKTDTIPFEVDV
ncbi:MAG: WxcM-like domain-containing protein [Methanoregula sp.]|nr:WxcM-like domain-containing protein [Methanoregula sp.]